VKLSDFQVLSFDCYGTLIDWESGIYGALAPLRARLGRSGAVPGAGLSRGTGELSRQDMLQAFARLESRQQEKTPGMLYSDLLAEVHGQLAVEWDLARLPRRTRRSAVRSPTGRHSPIRWQRCST